MARYCQVEPEFGLLSAADVVRPAGSTAADAERLVGDRREQGGCSSC